jgi:hypothetical protein
MEERASPPRESDSTAEPLASSNDESDSADAPAAEASEKEPPKSDTKKVPASPAPSRARGKNSFLERFSFASLVLGALGVVLSKIADSVRGHEFALDSFRIVSIALTAAIFVFLVVHILRAGRGSRARGSIAIDVLTAVIGAYFFGSSGLDAINRLIPTKWDSLKGIVQEHRSDAGQTHAKVWIVDRGVDTYFWRPLPLEIDAKIEVYVRRGIFGLRIGTLAPPS